MNGFSDKLLKVPVFHVADQDETSRGGHAVLFSYRAIAIRALIAKWRGAAFPEVGAQIVGWILLVH